MESGYFARNITTILARGNINPVNVDRSKISSKVLKSQGKLLPRKTV